MYIKTLILTSTSVYKLKEARKSLGLRMDIQKTKEDCTSLKDSANMAPVSTARLGTHFGKQRVLWEDSFFMSGLDCRPVHTRQEIV